MPDGGQSSADWINALDECSFVGLDRLRHSTHDFKCLIPGRTNGGLMVTIATQASTCEPAPRRAPQADEVPFTCRLAARATLPADLPGRVVSVLLRPEGAPTTAEWVRVLGAQDAAGGGVAIRDVDAGDLAVAVVVRRSAHRVEGCGGVPALSEPADGTRGTFPVITV